MSSSPRGPGTTVHETPFRGSLQELFVAQDACTVRSPFTTTTTSIGSSTDTDTSNCEASKPTRLPHAPLQTSKAQLKHPRRIPNRESWDRNVALARGYCTVQVFATHSSSICCVDACVDGRQAEIQCSRQKPSTELNLQCTVHATNS